MRPTHSPRYVQRPRRQHDPALASPEGMVSGEAYGGEPRLQLLNYRFFAPVLWLGPGLNGRDIQLGEGDACRAPPQ